MQIDIAAYVEKLLFIHDSLVIPGFGGFTATRTAAAADYVGGTVNPPSKTLSFSENLTVDDGLLTQEIAQSTGMSLEEARQLIAEFVEKTQELLGQREIVTLPGVGRLYKNYVQKIQFLPDASNFNAASYGLPPLQFSPIPKTKEIEKPTTTAVQTPVSNPVKTEIKPAATAIAETPALQKENYPDAVGESESSGNWRMILSLLLLVAAIAAGVFIWKKKHKAAENPVATEMVKTDSEQSATEQSQEPEKKDKEPETVQEALSKAAKESLDQKTQAAREALSGAKAKKCILIVATLQDPTNANRLNNMLKNEGYDVYFVQKKGYQVGIKFDYTQASEIAEKKSALAKLTGENNIFVLKK